ncbi:MAG: hypothetical protein ABMB14_17650 [Myxococcota bacterium]
MVGWLFVGCGGSSGDVDADTGADAAASDASAAAIVLVIDDSPSMIQHLVELIVATSDLSVPADSRIAVTTTDGTGALVGELITADHGPELHRQVCGALCASDALPSDPSYACGEPVTQASVEALDCLCGAEWGGTCRSAEEQGLEAAYRALATPGLLSEGYRGRIVVISDEGDRSATLAEGDPSVGDYPTLIGDAVFDAVIPALDPTGTVICPGTATDWGVGRYATMADRTGGALISIHDDACAPASFGAAVAALLAEP